MCKGLLKTGVCEVVPQLRIQLGAVGEGPCGDFFGDDFESFQLGGWFTVAEVVIRDDRESAVKEL